MWGLNTTSRSQGVALLFLTDFIWKVLATVQTAECCLFVINISIVTLRQPEIFPPCYSLSCNKEGGRHPPPPV